MGRRPPVNIIEYDEKYAPQTVRMWRASMENALNFKDEHSWEEQRSYLEAIAQQYRVFLAFDEDT
jgi:hypothetical protein